MYDVPNSLGEAVDLYRETRDLRLDMEKEAEAQIAPIKSFEDKLRAHIIQALSESSGVTGVAGKAYRAQLVLKRMPKVTDWAQVFTWVRDTGRFDLLQKRLSNPAVAGLWESDVDVPGIEPVAITELSVTKV